MPVLQSKAAALQLAGRTSLFFFNSQSAVTKNISNPKMKPPLSVLYEHFKEADNVETINKNTHDTASPLRVKIHNIK